MCSSCLLGGFDSSAYLAIIWHSQVKVYFSLPSFLLQPSRSKLTLHSAQLFRRGWCWYLRDDDARWRYIHSGRFCYRLSRNSQALMPTISIYTLFWRVISAETILFWKWKMWKFSYSFHIMADFVKHFWDNAFENFEGKFHETFWTILQYLSIILIPQPSLTRLFTFQSYC